MTRRVLDLDSEAIEGILPHRRPMLFVDRALDLTTGEHPTLRAQWRVRSDDPVFAGHFPDRPIWPGVLTIEGLAQTAQLLLAIAGTGDDGEAAPPRIGLLVRVDVKLAGVVRPADRLDYRATRDETRLGMTRCSVAAHVTGREVARGRITVSSSS